MVEWKRNENVVQTKFKSTYLDLRMCIIKCMCKFFFAPLFDFVVSQRDRERKIEKKNCSFCTLIHQLLLP